MNLLSRLANAESSYFSLSFVEKASLVRRGRKEVKVLREIVPMCRFPQGYYFKVSLFVIGEGITTLVLYEKIIPSKIRAICLVYRNNPFKNPCYLSCLQR